MRPVLDRGDDGTSRFDREYTKPVAAQHLLESSREAGAICRVLACGDRRHGQVPGAPVDRDPELRQCTS